MNKVIRATDAPRPLGIYSQAIVAGGFVFVSGQVAVNPVTNQIEYGDIQSETERTLKNVEAILKAAGCRMKEVVRVGVFLANLADFAAMNEVYKKFFPENPPARSTVGVQLPRFKVEIDCVARLPEKPKARRRGRRR